ncbi:hypothetical protein R1flu_022181 [Riccia fluitans]|uniref:Uncharacterized protein n=1 Tax=Riccia fluitans TaxID=41844 RepID=A0ABD1ZRJ2_9MARC
MAEEDREHVKPSGWEAAWEAAQDELAPSAEVKKAAETLVWCELIQQSMGWLLLTQIGILLGSFGQLMSQPVCLLSWGIFTLEAILKYGRSWAHNHFFRDVPCAYVPIHQEAAQNSLAFFGLFVLAATILELALYVPYLYSCVRFWHSHRICYRAETECPDGTTRLIEMLIASVIIACFHWISSFVTVFAFKAAMGMGFTALTQSKKYQSLKRKPQFKSFERFKSKRSPSDRLLCLTWWVHMARHRHLSAVVASAQPDDCALPGHWFESVYQLKRIVEESDSGDHVHLDPSGPLCVSQEMALRALVSMAKQFKDQISTEILSDDGFLLLVRVVREGKRETCRGLAAAAIAVLAKQSAALDQEKVDLAAAVVPLKRLAWSSNVEHTEVAFGALLNSSLNKKQSSKVIDKILSSDGMAIGEDESGNNFVSSIIEHAHRSHTTRCQELAVSLLNCLVQEKAGKPVRMAMAPDAGRRVSGVQLCTSLLKHGLTAQIRANAAGALAELVYWKDGQAAGSGPYSDGCVEAVVNGLEQELTVASASAKALCCLAYNNQDIKLRIVNAGGIRLLVNILRDPRGSTQRKSFGRRDTNRPRFQRLLSGISFETVKKIDEVESSSHMRASADSEKILLEEGLRSDAARALRILALNNPPHQQLIVTEGAIPLLIDLLARQNPKVHVQAIPALSALSWKNRCNQDLIGEYSNGKFFEGLAHTLAVADSHDDMVEVLLEKVSLAVTTLADGNESNRQNLLKHKIIKRKLEEFVAKKDQVYKNKTFKYALRALEILNIEQPT